MLGLGLEICSFIIMLLCVLQRKKQWSTVNVYMRNNYTVVFFTFEEQEENEKLLCKSIYYVMI